MVIPTSMPIIDLEMEEEVIRALREEFFIGGESVEKFEDEFAEYIGADYAVAVGSGTDALVIALRSLGIKKTVITTPMTFVATVESIVLAGATPKFADICADTWNISSEEIEKWIDNDVEAIKCPTGLIPEYKDLRKLFNQVLNKEYAEEDYIKQFTIRIPENLEKLERVEKFHRENVVKAPKRLFDFLLEQRERLLKAREQFGDYISPENW